MVRDKSGEQCLVPSSVILELDLELKTHGFSATEREIFHKDLSALIPKDSILPLTPRVVGVAAGIEGLGYFDSLLVALALCLGAEIVTTDKAMGAIEGINCIW